MIEAALEALRTAGLIEAGQRAHASTVIGRSLNVQVFPADCEDFYNVKLSRFDLEPEYRALIEVRNLMPDAVPDAIALQRTADLNALITRGFASKSLRTWPNSLTEFIWRYQAIQLKELPFSPGAPIRQREALARMIDIEAMGELRRPMSAWLQSDASGFLDELPGVLQHGDFALTNIAATSSGYVIYDWEDFGKVGLPGFDVCVFLLDATGALDRNAGLTAVLASSDPMVATLRGRLLEGLGLRADAFPHLVLASLAGFLYLKSVMQYGAPIIEMTKQLIAQMLEGDGVTK